MSRERTYVQSTTPIQLAFLAAIDTQIRLRGYAPTIRELCGALGLRSTNSAAETIARLRRDGLLEGEPRPVRARSLELTDAGREALDARRWRFLEIVDGRAVPA